MKIKHAVYAIKVASIFGAYNKGKDAVSDMAKVMMFQGTIKEKDAEKMALEMFQSHGIVSDALVANVVAKAVDGLRGGELSVQSTEVNETYFVSIAYVPTPPF